MAVYGIDLGTTNSSIARLIGSSVKVFKDGGTQLEIVPSAVHINRSGSVIVGVEARNRAFGEPDNAVIEFKRNMGADSPFTFKRFGRTMQPEELSAEVLKKLNANVVAQSQPPVTAAVITVPADFDQPQWEATLRAATLAGIKKCLLHPEPVAAAQAYSFDNEADNTFWLVYDLGGGTFDAAIIRVKDGLINVVEHKGHNRLGGADIDNAIINELLVPALPASFTDEEKQCIRSRDPRWAGAWSRLKGAAEGAKIALSNPSVSSAPIDIDYLGRALSGAMVEFNYTLQRADLDRIATPIIHKTINFVREVLSAARVSPADIGKMILVGGPTMMPLVRTMLRELQIEMEYGVDPMTVVAQGAAIIARSQLQAEDEVAVAAAGEFSVRLDYQPVSPEIEPVVAGTFAAYGGAETDFTGFTFEFVNESMMPPWRSGKAPLNQTGAFMATLFAERGIANQYRIELADAQGTIYPVVPPVLEILVKGSGVIGDTVHNHDIGVELANDSVLVLYQKGQPLPFRSRLETLWTTVAIKRGESDRFLCVPVCEGERARASRNRRIGELIIKAADVPIDIPAGTPIYVGIEVDSNMIVETMGRIDLIGKDFRQPQKGSLQSPDPNRLRTDARHATERLAKLRESAANSTDASANAVLQQIDEEGTIAEIDSLVSQAANDSGAGRGCVDLLHKLGSRLDALEDILEWPTLTTQASAVLSKTRQQTATDEYATDADRRVFAMSERELNEAIRARSVDALRRCIDALERLDNDIIARDPSAWVNTFKSLRSRVGQMTDGAQAGRLIVQGEGAIRTNDVTTLKEAVRGLWALEPDESPMIDGILRATVSR